MDADWTTAAPAKDRRVRRSRSALMRAALDLVTERDSAAVAVSDIAEAADVSRQVLYQQFGDLDTLLLETALDLIRRELLDNGGMDAVLSDDAQASALAMARHFACHRRFYRALLTGSCAFALNKALIGLFLPLNRQLIERLHGARLGPQTIDDLAIFVTGGASAVVNTWVVEEPDPLDPEEFTARRMRMWSVVTTAMENP